MRLSVEETLRNLKQVEEKNKIRFTPTGEVNISEMARDCIDTIEALQAENEQLQAQVARMREACILGYSYLSLILHRADIKNWNEVGMCSVKDIKHVLNELESAYKGGNTPTEYHNPADVELLRKVRNALHKGISELKVHCKYFDQTPEEDACIEMHEAVVEIDKAIGGKEDA